MKRINSKIVNEIYQTKDFSAFKIHKENREINPMKVKRIANSMSKHGFLNQPIKVNPDMVIIDGQHRYFAAKMINVPILYFIDRSNMDLYDNMLETNRNQSSWTKHDYIHGLAEKGKESYSHLLKFQKEFPEFSLTEQIMFMSNSFTSVNKNTFAQGKWKHKNIGVARDWATNLMSLKPYFKQGFNKSLFVRAMIDIMTKHPGFNFNDFLHKIQLRPGSIYLCGDVPSYKVMIENIYNYKRKSQDKLNLRF